MLKTKFTDQSLDLPITQGIVLRRDSSGMFYSNVPHAAILHSPSGFESGYFGSGPADLALNAVQAILVTLGYQGVMTSEDSLRRLFWGNVFCMALKLHQGFKDRFIAPALVENEGQVALPYSEVVWFIKRELAQSGQVICADGIDESALRDEFDALEMSLSEFVIHDYRTTGQREIEFAVAHLAGRRFRITEAQHLRFADLPQVVEFVKSGREIVYVGACSVSRIS